MHSKEVKVEPNIDSDVISSQDENTNLNQRNSSDYAEMMITNSIAVSFPDCATNSKQEPVTLEVEPSIGVRCAICRQLLPTEQERVAYRSNNVTDVTYTCLVCRRIDYDDRTQFYNQINRNPCAAIAIVDNHILNIEENQTTIKDEEAAFVKCDICRSLLPTAQKLVAHRLIHTLELMYTCLMCHDTYDDRTQLVLHIEQMHTSVDAVNVHLTNDLGKLPTIKDELDVRIQCDICLQLFPTKQKLFAHRPIHTAELTYTCLMCYGTYDTKPQLYMHIQQMHACADVIDDYKMALQEDQIIIKDEPSVGVECDICRQILHTEQKLVTHRLVHAMELNYRCLMCYGTYEDRTQLYKHINQMASCTEPLFRQESIGKTADPLKEILEGKRKLIVQLSPFSISENSYDCLICSKVFKWKLCLIEHVCKHALEKLYECDICHKTFRQQNQLQTHAKEHACSIKCSVCDKQFRRKCNLTTHMRTCSGEKPYDVLNNLRGKGSSHKCNICHKLFSRKDVVTRHLLTHGEHPKRMLNKCNICLKPFARKDHLKLHISRVHPGKESYAYGPCDKSFKSKKKLKVHTNTHAEEKSLKCPISSETFLQKDIPEAHIPSHSNENSHGTVIKLHEQKEDKTFLCDICRKVFSRKRYVAQHLRTHGAYSERSSRDMFLCLICDNRMSSKCSLKRHMLNVHSENKLHTLKEVTLRKTNICLVCNKKFSEAQCLTQHLRTHGKSRIECHICHKLYSRKDVLASHILRMHRNEEPHASDICQKSFKSNKMLKVHTNTHAEEESFKCLICSETFLQKDILEAHIPSHSNENSHGTIVKLHEQKEDKTFSCNICHKVFSTKKYEMLHLRTHGVYSERNSRDMFSCLICHNTMSSKCSLKRHMLNVHSENRLHTLKELGKAHICRMCDKVFREERYLTQHLRTHSVFSKGSSIECHICHKIYTRKDTLSSHILRMHPNETPYTCDICHISFNRKNLHAEHMHAHKKETLYECDICHKSFKTKVNLKSHNKYIHAKEKPFKCLICSKGFVGQHKLNIHIRTHTGEKPFACDKCPKFFYNDYYFKTHLRKHGEDNSIVCDICHKTLASKITFIRHIHTHKPLNAKGHRTLHICSYSEKEPFKCLICNKLFRRKTNLKDHIICVHDGKKRYNCNICDKTFSKCKYALRHELNHTKRKYMECDICHKQLVSKNTLTLHMRIHTGEKPYKCDVCHKRFATADVLKVHKTIHTKQKLHKCGVCHKQFRWIPNLKLHMRIHTGEEPYQCSFCSKRFKTSSNLSCHIRSHHNF